MDFNTVVNREILIRAFGDDLRNDPNFKLTSESTYKYNCIAFAMGMDDRWVDACNVPWHWWPPVKMDMSPDSLVLAFEHFGFEKCDMNDSIEENYDKVVLYKLRGAWTHAARVTGNNKYHSKFGELFDGTHSSGDILSRWYGEPYQVMRRPKSDAHLTDDLKGAFVGHTRASMKLHLFMDVDGVHGYVDDYVTRYKGKSYLEHYGNEVIRIGWGYKILPKKLTD